MHEWTRIGDVREDVEALREKRIERAKLPPCTMCEGELRGPTPGMIEDADFRVVCTRCSRRFVDPREKTS